MRSFALVLLLCFISHASFAEEDYLDYPGMGSESNNQRCMDIADPYEKFNRAVFAFNSVLDYFILKPIARGYWNAANEEFRGKVSNALDNSFVPLTMVNNVLQKEPHNALLSFWQFVVNTTFGIGGLENVAKKTGLQVKEKTFGSTLASYGVGPGPYIFIPFFGGKSMRDMWDPIILNSLINPRNYVISKKAKYALAASWMVSERANILPFTEHVAKTSTDPYITIRSAMHQNREKDLDYPTYYRCKR